MYYWTGGHRLHDNQTFEWINGDKFDYSNFLRGKSERKGALCLGVQLEYGGWKAENCFQEFGFVCHFGVSQNVTPTDAVIPPSGDADVPIELSTTALPGTETTGNQLM